MTSTFSSTFKTLKSVAISGVQHLTKEPSSVSSMLRVNHAGEYGATCIYAGQLFVLGHDQTVQHMANQEQDHLKAFTHLLVEHHTRPSLLQPLWHIGGFMMGAITAAMGRNVAHACTAAVETIIDEHYQDQLAHLQNHPSALVNDATTKNLTDLITRCKEEECEHKQIAIDEAGEDLEKRYPITTHVIKTITKGAIFIAKRI